MTDPREDIQIFVDLVASTARDEETLARALVNARKYRFDPGTQTFRIPGPQDFAEVEIPGPQDFFAELEETPSVPSKAGEHTPPAILDYLLPALLKGARGEALIGDLNELFARDCKSYGEVRARRLYWGRAISSVWPLLRRLAIRALKLGTVVETVRRFFWT